MHQYYQTWISEGSLMQYRASLEVDGSYIDRCLSVSSSTRKDLSCNAVCYILVPSNFLQHYSLFQLLFPFMAATQDMFCLPHFFPHTPPFVIIPCTIVPYSYTVPQAGSRIISSARSNRLHKRVHHRPTHRTRYSRCSPRTPTGRHTPRWPMRRSGCM